MIALIASLALAQYTPSEAKSLFDEANAAYAEGNYPAAEAKLTKLVDSGFGSATVLYNLGTVFLAAGDLGPAALFLERASRAGAGGDDLATNLKLLSERQGDSVVGEHAAPPFWQRLAVAVDEREVSIAFLIAWWSACILLTAWWNLRGRVARVPIAVAALVLFAASAMLFGSAVNAAYFRRNVTEAIVMTKEASVLAFPLEQSKAAFEVHAGLKVQVLEQSGGYSHIRLANALQGWVSAESLAPL